MKDKNSVPFSDLTYKSQRDKIDIPCDGETKRCIPMSRKRKATLRKDGRYQCNARLGSKYKPCYGKTENEAITKAEDLEQHYKDSQEQQQQEKISNTKYTFSNCFYRYRNWRLRMKIVQPQTVDREEQTYLRYIPKRELARKDVRKLTTKDIYTFLISIIQEYEAITNKEWQRIRHVIKAVIDYVYDEEFDFSDDAPKIDWDKIKRKVPKGKIYTSKKREYAVAKKEQTKLYETMVEDKQYPEKYAGILCLMMNFSLGLRVGELAALTEDDIDWQRKVICVSKTVKKQKKRDEFGNCIKGSIYKEGSPKTVNGTREIPMTPRTEHILRLLFDYRKTKGYSSKYLCYDGKELEAKAENLRKTLAAMCKKADVEAFNTHRIRKSFASELSTEPDIELAQISEYLGHSEIATTLNNYILASKETIEEQIHKMERKV